jgi:hypothetical protein
MPDGGIMRVSVIALVFLVGCTFTQSPVLPDEIVWHPRMPEPIQSCPVETLVIISEGVPYVGYTYADSLQKALCEEKTITYIQQLHDILCYYKQNCLKETHEETE